jgi:hypothetical protein
MRGYVLDAGALGALDERDQSAPRIARLLASAAVNELALVVPATALAQAYFDGGRQARLARLIAQTYIVLAVLDRTAAKEVGAMRHRTRHADVVDVHVAWLARTHDLTVVTSDPDDMRKLGVDARKIVVV